MVIYICNDCNKILVEVFITAEITFKKALAFKSDISDVPDKGYHTQVITHQEKQLMCPLCKHNNVNEITLTKETFTDIYNFLEKNNVKDAWEILFDFLL